MRVNEANKRFATGLVLIMLGMVGGTLAAFASYQGLADPTSSPEGILDFESGYREMTGQRRPPENLTLYLRKGEYELWYGKGDYGTGTPGQIDAWDLEGRKIEVRRDAETRMNAYRRTATFRVERSGNHTFHTDRACTLYVTEPVEVELGLGLMSLFCLLGLASIVGGVVFVLKGLRGQGADVPGPKGLVPKDMKTKGMKGKEEADHPSLYVPVKMMLRRDDVDDVIYGRERREWAGWSLPRLKR